MSPSYVRSTSGSVGAVNNRFCSHAGCRRESVSTLTYVYSDSMVVIGPLSPHREPHAYDLCADHAQRFTVPRGWTVLRNEVMT